ncbi:MAG: HD domain-containing phosphohydrolase [Sulfurimonas sp.]|jgi:HD-GYP domain-containing protein (c-di-GMP phosphodiesterase class II)/ribonuclease BN (tRNA processing enzyme)
MDYIKMLGSHGSRSTNTFTTCIQVNKHTLIDAGNIMHALGEDALHIDRIFFTHSHLDHIIDSAFLIDNFFAKRTKPLRLYGLSQTIYALKKHFFNSEIWPDFSNIHLLNSKGAAIEYIEIQEGESYEIENDTTLTPILSNHSIACCGYIIKKEQSALLFSSDTYKNPLLWEIINKTPSIKALIIDVSFPSRFAKVAQESKHLTPKLLKEELLLLERKNLHIYVNHLKPFYAKQIVEELFAMGINKENILIGDEFINLKDGSLHREKRSSMHDTITKLTAIGTALSAEENIDILLDMIVTEAKNLTQADGGTLYLVDGETLRFKVVQTDSLGIKMGGTNDPITWPPLPLYLEDKTPNKKMVAATCALEDRIVNIPDVYEAKGFSFEGTKKFDAGTNYRSKSMLVIPLKNHENEVIGVLQLINKKDGITQESIPFNDDDASITLSLASQAAVSITNTMLIQGLEDLLEAFLKSIIFAVGKKSPFTEGHINRMVRLSQILCNEINADKTIYKEKSFNNEEMREIHFAALMHDIGKLATPEQILDKAKKLEAISDRIALVQSRFEVIKKSLYIAFLEHKITKEEYEQKKELLEVNLKIIEISNMGAEFTKDEDIAAITEMAQNPWVIDGTTYELLTLDEAHHLSVQKGTLTTGERDIINEHAQISVDILNKLPFPKKYKNIPQISGSHHEKINGKGYPLGLKGDEISFEARILAIADIFEALTASDRPYKKVNPLSSAMKILYFMAKDGDLDRDLVKFFYDSKLYLSYAKEFLPQSSIDEVTVDFSTL